MTLWQFLDRHAVGLGEGVEGTLAGLGLLVALWLVTRLP